LVHALGRSAGGAKLPSAGLCLNASKAASYLAEAVILLHSVCRGAEIRPIMVGSQCQVHECVPRWLQLCQIRLGFESSYHYNDVTCCDGRPQGADHLRRCQSVELSVDDLFKSKQIIHLPEGIMVNESVPSFADQSAVYAVAGQCMQ
jgi:hypothetical protein